MAEPRRLEVTITADTSAFQRAVLRTLIRFERRWWRRLWLRFRLWRARGPAVERDIEPVARIHPCLCESEHVCHDENILMQGKSSGSGPEVSE